MKALLISALTLILLDTAFVVARMRLPDKHGHDDLKDEWRD